MNIDTDKQFTTERIKRAEPGKNEDGPGWTLSFEGGFCLWCTANECQVEPQPGEEARLYGEGFGRTVRGIAIGMGACIAT